jgi:hypothetical protein
VGCLPRGYSTGFYANLAREQRSKLLQPEAARQPADDSGKRDAEERRLGARLKAESDGKKQREDEERRARAAAAAERERAERERAERDGAEREKARREELARIEREKVEQERARREEIARAQDERRAREHAEREKPAAAEPGKTRIAMLPPAAEPVGRPPPRSSKSGNAKKKIRPPKTSNRHPTKPKEKTRTTSNQTSSSPGEVCIIGPGYVNGRFRRNSPNGRRCFHR